MRTESNTPPLNILKPLAGRALEQALNALVQLDPDTQAALHTLNAKRIALSLEAPALALEISVQEGLLRVGPALEEEADLGIRSTLSGALSQLPFFRDSQRPLASKVRINGDAELAQRLQKLAKNFDPDWDKPFVSVFGIIIGTQIAKALREALKQGEVIAKKLARDSADFLTEESRDVISAAELNAFNDDVDALRDRAERIIARVEKLRTGPSP
jgi:ubiquinone biosynthesis accessory factor UbiJ